MMSVLVSPGARVILACRDVDKATRARAEIVLETANRNIDVIQLDLASLQSIKQFTEHIIYSKSYMSHTWNI